MVANGNYCDGRKANTPRLQPDSIRYPVIGIRLVRGVPVSSSGSLVPYWENRVQDAQHFFEHISFNQCLCGSVRKSERGPTFTFHCSWFRLRRVRNSCPRWETVKINESACGSKEAGRRIEDPPGRNASFHAPGSSNARSQWQSQKASLAPPSAAAANSLEVTLLLHKPASGSLWTNTRTVKREDYGERSGYVGLDPALNSWHVPKRGQPHLLRVSAVQACRTIPYQPSFRPGLPQSAPSRTCPHLSLWERQGEIADVMVHGG